MKKQILAMLLLLLPLGMTAQNWDYIRTSGEYYYGVGHGQTEVEASEQAMADLVSMIATNVSSEFLGLEDETNTGGRIQHKSKVLSCVRTYSQSTLTNVEKWVTGEAPNVTVRRYMKRSELAHIYENRIAKAKDMIAIADEAVGRTKIDMALQYYYWAYALLRTIQRPNEVTDAMGRVLVNWLPVRIEDILDKIQVAFEKREGDCVDLLFSYDGQPLSSLEFTYSDGRAECQGTAKDGRGMIEMVPGYETDVYHVNIGYEYKGQARGDDEMQSVLDVVSRKTFRQAEVSVKGKPGQQPVKGSVASMDIAATGGYNLQPQASQLVTEKDENVDVMGRVIEAIRRKRYSDVTTCFTLDGLDMYNQLISYGTGRIVGTPDIKFFKSHDGRVVARGLQMSFSFNRGTKKTFVEDVVLTFNASHKIENVAFGLGQIAENDILCKYAPGWKDETREMIMEFMENYKTAYCLKRIDYIRDIFADDAVIIIGNVAKRRPGQRHQEREITLEGREVITTNRYTKDEYLRNLKRCFDRNEFINIRFTHNDVQWLEKFEKEELFAIQIGQEYNSTTYGDKGYLFLLVDMTDHQAPQIKIRTWQPNEVDMKKIYNAGDFYRD